MTDWHPGAALSFGMTRFSTPDSPCAKACAAGARHTLAFDPSAFSSSLGILLALLTLAKVGAGYVTGILHRSATARGWQALGVAVARGAARERLT